jgi:uncharacterized protein YdcH (DUF465 family)
MRIANLSITPLLSSHSPLSASTSMNWLSSLLLLIPALLNTAFAAEPLTDAVATQIEANRASAATQQSIERLGDQSRQMADEYREALRQSETLQAYNAHLRQLVDSQESSKQSLERQIGNLELTRREIVPLMLKMLDALDRFVQIDKPFLSEDRSRRIADLKEMMIRADVGDAEKFHRLMDAYQSENEYGKTIESYRGELTSGSTPRTVDFLRIGRVALLYRTLDGKEAGFWSSRTKTWKSLPSGSAEQLSKGFAVARKEIPPEWLLVPVELAEAAK